MQLHYQLEAERFAPKVFSFIINKSTINILVVLGMKVDGHRRGRSSRLPHQLLLRWVLFISSRSVVAHDVQDWWALRCQGRHA